ncbi:HTH_Tnp_Tc3_2 domain-containing protein [Trichonephila clavipes]|nr:HTH_Tnp_Tc3_2 domain-containing protein [Trichonephila clavipes]
MPLRRNRRQYEQLADVGAYNRPQRKQVESNRRIGRHLGRNDMAWCSVLATVDRRGRVYRRGVRTSRNTNDREDRAIRRVATSAPTTSLASIQRHLPPSRHPGPSRETIRRRLTEGWLEVDVRKTLPLTPHHRQCRLDFCRPRASGV